jgi:hypothetical protein
VTENEKPQSNLRLILRALENVRNLSCSNEQ